MRQRPIQEFEREDVRPEVFHATTPSVGNNEPGDARREPNCDRGANDELPAGRWGSEDRHDSADGENGQPDARRERQDTLPSSEPTQLLPCESERLHGGSRTHDRTPCGIRRKCRRVGSHGGFAAVCRPLGSAARARWLAQIAPDLERGRVVRPLRRAAAADAPSSPTPPPPPRKRPPRRRPV